MRFLIAASYRLFNYLVTPEEIEKNTTELFDLISQRAFELTIHDEYKFSAEGVKQAQEDLTGGKTRGKLIVKVKQDV